MFSFKNFYFIIFINLNNNYCCKNCCCCKNKKYSNNNNDDDEKKFKSNVEFIKKEDVEKLIDPNFNLETKRDVFEKRYNEFKNDFEKVKNLLENDLKYNYLNNEPHFPHIHWNGNVNNSYKLLCFMIAPLNVILHLDKIKEFFKSNPKPKDNNLKDINEVYWYIYNSYWIDVFRLYVERLENGYSFTLDPQKDKDGNPKYIFELGLFGKANEIESLQVSNNFFKSVINKYIHNYKFLNIDFTDFDSVGLFESKDIIEYQEIIDQFVKIQKGKEDNFDIIYLATQKMIAREKDSNFNDQKNNIKEYMDQISINNIKEKFNYAGNTYHLEGLVYFGTNSNKLEDNGNDCFSFVYDKNATDKSKPYVYCQLNCPMKYYSLKEIEEGMKPDKTNISSYKYHHLIACAYSK